SERESRAWRPYANVAAGDIGAGTACQLRSAAVIKHSVVEMPVASVGVRVGADKRRTGGRRSSSIGNLRIAGRSRSRVERYGLPRRVSRVVRSIIGTGLPLIRTAIEENA